MHVRNVIGDGVTLQRPVIQAVWKATGHRETAHPGQTDLE